MHWGGESLLEVEEEPLACGAVGVGQNYMNEMATKLENLGRLSVISRTGWSEDILHRDSKKASWDGHKFVGLLQDEYLEVGNGVKEFERVKFCENGYMGIGAFEL